MTYQPKPIDVSNIELSETLIALQEKLAENAHEVWSQERIKQGWTYGKKEMIPIRSIPVWFHMKNCLSQKSILIESLL